MTRRGGATGRRAGWIPRRGHGLLLAAAVVVPVACSGAGGEAPEPDLREYCAHLRASSAMTVAFDELDLDALQTLVPELEAAASVAPDDIRADTETVAEFARAVLDRWDAAEPLDLDTAQAAFHELEADRPEVENAGKALEAYAQEECHFNLRHPPTTTTSVPAAPTTTEATTASTAPPTTLVAPTTWTPAPTASLPPDANTTTTVGVLTG